MKRRSSRCQGRGFTLVELLVALAVMALLALLSWRGLDGMAKAHERMQWRMDGVASLQTGLAQWSADLDAVMETGQVSPIDYDGRVLRLTRRDTALPDSPVRVVGWARRVTDGAQGGQGSWARWQSPPLRTRADLQMAWGMVQQWAQNASAAEKQREVAVVGLDQWQIFYYRNDAWSNPLSSAATTPAGAPAGTPAGASPSTSGTASPTPGAAITPPPDGIRLVLTLSAGQPVSGVITKDWVRPMLGGGKG